MSNKECWGVWCEVWGGVTGRRVSWLKRDDKIATFNSFEEARDKAWELTQGVAKFPSAASFSYTAQMISKGE